MTTFPHYVLYNISKDNVDICLIDINLKVPVCAVMRQSINMFCSSFADSAHILP